MRDNTKTVSDLLMPLRLQDIELMEQRLARLPDYALEERIALRELIIKKRIEYGLQINI